ncbi:MAG: hypothetical protein OSB38_39090, partial [Paraburkholderia fungorum]|nr:hypothetical protein [Paraburkholderia fungorum]
HHHYSRWSGLDASVSALNYLALKTAGGTGGTKDGGRATSYIFSDSVCPCSLKVCHRKGIGTFSVSKST